MSDEADTAMDGPASEMPQVTLDIADVATLDAMRMPFVRHGGLFIEHSRLGGQSLPFGHPLMLVLRIGHPALRLTSEARVVWVMPAAGQHIAGVGVQFSEADAPALRQRLQVLRESV